MKIFNSAKYLLLIILNYYLFFFLIYIISGFLLIKGITPNLKLINSYQVNFYLEAGMRNIWQSNPDCVQYDKDLIYVPKLKNCKFKNLEFDTNVSFDQYGRYSKHPNIKSKQNNSIVVLGDSYAMGWGVNDDETFSSLLETKINRNVYNLAVSSYGTWRELIRLEKSGLLNQVDTIIIQYCYNDFGENTNFKIRSDKNSNYNFQTIISQKPVSNWRKLRRTFRYSAKIPVDLITKEKNSLDFSSHKELLLDILSQHSSIKNKKIYILYINGPNLNFYNFPNEKISNLNDIIFLNMEIENKHYFKIDGHLNKLGHKFVANELSKVIK